MFKMVFQDFRAEFVDNLKEEKKNVLLYLLLSGIYVFLIITSYSENTDKIKIVQLVNFLLLFVLIKCTHNIFPNKLQKIMLLLPLTDDEKYKYLEVRLIIKQLIILAVMGTINIFFVCMGYIKLSVVVLGIINVQLLSLVLGVITNCFDKQINTFFEIMNICVGILNFIFILTGELFMEIPKNINNILIAVLFVLQIAGALIIVRKFKNYAQIEPKQLDI